MADLRDSRILRDGDSITALDIFTVALPCFGFVRLFVRFLYIRSERADFRPERADFRPERAPFRPERAWGD